MEKQICEMAEIICDNMVHGLCDTDGSVCNHNCEYKCRAKDLYNEGYRKQEWISVEERLPAEDVRVLVWLRRDLRTEYTRIDTDRRLNGVWVRWYESVTHWMPLPSAPKGE